MLDISGSAWESYKKTGKVNGMTMPEGLKESDKLEHPIWTPRFVYSYKLPGNLFKSGLLYGYTNTQVQHQGSYG